MRGSTGEIAPSTAPGVPAGEDGGAAEGRYVRWPIFTARGAAGVQDVTRLRAHPLVNPAIPIHGLIYDVRTGRLREVEAASAAGRARG